MAAAVAPLTVAGRAVLAGTAQTALAAPHLVLDWAGAAAEPGAGLAPLAVAVAAAAAMAAVAGVEMSQATPQCQATPVLPHRQSTAPYRSQPTVSPLLPPPAAAAARKLRLPLLLLLLLAELLE